MNQLEKLFFYSWLNWFLYTKSIENNWLFCNSKYCFIQLILKENQIIYINNNFEKFSKILEKFLSLYNSISNIKLKNITFWNIKDWDLIYNNSIFLYNWKNDKEWFIKSNWLISIFSNKKVNNKEIILKKILLMLKQKNISVRKLIKIWLTQTKARKIYNFLKENNIFIISKFNQMNKKYYLEKLDKTKINTIYKLIIDGV